MIVLGYSGWDDALVEALAACDDFDHRLFWCGREADPLAKGAFGPRVRRSRQADRILRADRKRRRFHGEALHRLVKGLPRLLDNPIGQLREMLETIDLAELKPIAAQISPGTQSTPQLDGQPNPKVFVDAQKRVIERLYRAEELFRVQTISVEAALDLAQLRRMQQEESTSHEVSESPARLDIVGQGRRGTSELRGKS